MGRLLAGLGLAVLLVTAAQPFVARPGAGVDPDPVAQQIRRMLVSEAGSSVRVRGEALRSLPDVKRFYATRDHRPAWERRIGGVDVVSAMLAAVRDAGADGLRPEDYHAAALGALMRRLDTAPLGASAAERAELDLLLSDAFLTLAAHRLRGRVDPVALHGGWTMRPRAVDLVAALASAVESSAPAVALRRLDPADTSYAILRDALRRYRALALAGWPRVPGGRALRPGEADARVALLRDRLARERGTADADTSTVFDAPLEQEVRRFQRTHGLEVDGIVGPATLGALAVSPAERALQLELNLERLRWQAGERGAVSVEVAIPAFELRLLEHGRTVMVRRIIGGRADWPTPIFGSAIDVITFSPYWNVPARIAALEVLPKVRRDPGWLAGENMRVLSGWGTTARIVNPSTIDWSRVTAASFGYRFRQEPGPGNPLGGVKFSVPNRWDIYLHDTSAPLLFERPLRAFSHGCMRLERPLDLAEYLLRGDSAWQRGDIEAAAAAGVERTVRLRARVPLHVVYRTVWVDDPGDLHFRADLYGHDARLARALGPAGGVAQPPDAVSSGCTSGA